jgi:hypothetical protein
MKRHAVMVGMLLLLLAPLSQAGAVSQEKPKLPPGRTDMKDKSQEDDCDCCQKCKAATRPTLSKEDTDDDKNTGCEDCCERCGRPLPMDPHESPPDIIDKPNR